MTQKNRFSLKIEFGLNITRKYSENVSSLADTVGIERCSGGFHPSPFLNDILKMNYVKKSLSINYFLDHSDIVYSLDSSRFPPKQSDPPLLKKYFCHERKWSKLSICQNGAHL